MPARDGTGPMGMGPMTGRGMGFCAGVVAPGPDNMTPGQRFGIGCGRGLGMGFGRGLGMGFGRGRGGGRGWRNMFYATGLTGWQRAVAGWPMTGGVPPYAAPTKEQELEVLKSQSENLGSALESIRKRIQEVESRHVEK